MHASNFLRNALFSALATAALAACGGGDNDGSKAAPVALAPLNGGTVYVGTVSFGDTISISHDSTAKTLTLAFADSRFGLAGAITSPYTVAEDGAWVAQAFQAVAGSTVPTGLTAALANVRVRVRADGALLTGMVERLPNLTRTDGALLQGDIAVSNQGAANLSQLAGQYNYIRQVTTYGADGKVKTAATTEAGQVRVSADGSLRVCAGQAYSDSCTVTGSLTGVQDQSRFPGALALTLSGAERGRVMVASAGGSATLFVDEFSTAADGSKTTGTWVLRSAGSALAATALDGEWICGEPALNSDGTPSGRHLRHYVSIGGGLLQTDTIDTDIELTANALAPASGTPVTGLQGLVAGRWKGGAGARTLLPVSSSTAYYVGSTPGATGTTATAISGSCHLQPARDTVAKYLGYQAGDIKDLTLADARPTQPAIGFDQVFYKQARYRNTANGSTEFRKQFADWCEAAGAKDAKGKQVTDASTLADRNSFVCETATGLDTANMKTAVVGPKGLVYLTDGHHTFTSFWEAPRGGGSAVTVPVIFKANYSADNQATFWRKMRANKTVWLQTPDGRTITPVDLPTQLGLRNGLQDDPFRALVYFTRDVGYAQPANSTEFLEFYWAEWLRATPRSVTVDTTKLLDASYYQANIRKAAAFMVAAADQDAIGSSGRTAVQMGKLASFNETEFAGLSTPVTDAKPGKLAYAQSYRATFAAGGK